MNDRFITASLILLTALIGINCSNEKNMNLEVFETSAAGNQLTQKTAFNIGENVVEIRLNPEERFQKITGFGDHSPSPVHICLIS